METKVWIAGLKSSYTYTGSSIKPEFRVYDGTWELKEKTDYTLSYKNNKNVGTAAIIIKFKGNYRYHKTESKSFTIVPAEFGRDIVAHDVGAEVKKKDQKPLPTLTWASSGKKVSQKYFTVSYDGFKSVKYAGTYTAYIAAANKNYKGMTTAKVTLVSDKGRLLSKAKVTFSPKSYPYTGEAIRPASYTLKLGGKILKEGTDYILKDENICNNVNPGKATVIFEAKEGNSAGYVGSKTATFKISGKKELKEGEPFSFAWPESVPYEKGGAKPKVTVIDKDSDITLQEGRDYTLSYAKNKAVTDGSKTAEIKVKGKGNYKKTVTLHFAVTPQSLDRLNITAADQFVPKAKLKKPSVTIRDLNGKKLAENKDFTVGKNLIYTGDDTTGSVTVTVTEKGTYGGDAKVSYRYLASSSSNISKAKKMKDIPAQEYNGNEVRLNMSELSRILYTGKKSSPKYLEPGKDFTVEGYKDNMKKGTAKVTLKGCGEFAGTKTLSFKINKKNVKYKGALVDGEWE
ncbi:MAG: hypothetical protein K6G83_01630 [Lachnospiraceae bacterium]|nr:hypothetical protein [Lachnospiraceae bacterium]